MSQRLLIKLNESFEQKNFYEAHQIYRTIYYRLVRDNQYAKVYDLLVSGANRLFDHGQHNSGADLANLLVDLLLQKVSSFEAVNHTELELIEHLKTLFKQIPANSPDRMQFVSRVLSIKYLSTAVVRKNFAEVLWHEKNFAESRLHFIYSSDRGDNCALMLIEYQTTAGRQSEFDLMIAQFVLQVLCLENHQLAHDTFYFYTLNHPQIRATKPPFMTPLLNFICFLMGAIQKFRGKSTVFNVLCSIYEKSLQQDPCYKDYLQQIGQIYFGVEKKHPTGGAGLFSNLLQSLFDMSPSDTTNNNEMNNHSFSSSSSSNGGSSFYTNAANNLLSSISNNSAAAATATSNTNSSSTTANIQENQEVDLD